MSQNDGSDAAVGAIGEALEGWLAARTALEKAKKGMMNEWGYYLSEDYEAVARAERRLGDAMREWLHAELQAMGVAPPASPTSEDR